GYYSLILTSQSIGTFKSVYFIVFNIKRLKKAKPYIPLAINPPCTGRTGFFMQGFYQGDSLALTLNC
ncbi:TPA: hypothetical protein ACYHIG_004586, partial [Escherichia coli]